MKLTKCLVKFSLLFGFVTSTVMFPMQKTLAEYGFTVTNRSANDVIFAWGNTAYTPCGRGATGSGESDIQMICTPQPYKFTSGWWMIPPGETREMVSPIRGRKPGKIWVLMHSGGRNIIPQRYYQKQKFCVVYKINITVKDFSVSRANSMFEVAEGGYGGRLINRGNTCKEIGGYLMDFYQMDEYTNFTVNGI